jgi:two-component system NarL family sensor kinase
MEEQKNTIVLVVFLSTFFILILIFIVYYTLFQYKKKQIKLKRDLELMNLTHEKNLLAAQLEIQEQTLKRIAREIHDNISLTLTLAKLHLNTYEMQKVEEDKELVRTGIDLIGKSLVDLNNLSKSLDAQTIERFGLVHALETESEMVRKSGRLNVELSIHGEPVKLDNERSLHVFRIIQECFNNSLKHSEAEHMSVKLDYAGDGMHVTVRDDGKGFDPEQARIGKPGSGLRNMENRATILGGGLAVKSMPGSGTETTITIPYQSTDASETKDQGGAGR